MKLICHGIEPDLSTRLTRKGLPTQHFDLAAPPAHDAPRCWLWNDLIPPPMLPGDLWLDLRPRPLDDNPGAFLPGVPILSAAWQNSPFAVDHGYLLAVGGQTELVLAARPLFDALAPQPGGWLHAGDLAAPRFLAAVAGRIGGSLQQLATLVVQGGPNALLPLLDLHRALLLDLAQLSQAYLARADPAPYRPALPVPPLFAPLSPDASESDSPAQRVAKLIAWLVRQQQG